MRAAIVSCSPRDNSESSRIAVMFKRYLCEHHTIDCDLVSLSDGVAEIFSQEGDNETCRRIRFALGASDMVILVVPEHCGMAPPAAKQLFMVFGMDCFAHKPTLLVGISSGMGGAYPITDMRSSTCKNSRILYIPEHIIIRKVTEVEHDFGSTSHPGLKERVESCVRMLLLYATGLSSLRKEMLELSTGIGYGM